MKKLLRFKSADFRELTDELRNPARGLYRIYGFRADRDPDLEELRWSLSDGETCALVIIDISAYRSRDLDAEAVMRARKILGFFNENRRDIILRIVYDREGRGIEREPFSFSQVLRHIAAFSPVFQEFSERIQLFEGVFVGSWGEMHGSKFLTKKYLCDLNAALAEAAPGIIRAVRKPAQWRTLFESVGDRGVGLFNDAVFGSKTDLGTFADPGSGSEAWQEPWEIGRELEFESELGIFAPQCAEAVCGEGSEKMSVEAAVSRLKKMGVTWLNGTYDEKILNIWKNSTYTAPGAWQGANGFDCISRRLGYRFCVRSCEAAVKRGAVELRATVENVGFSGIYQETEGNVEIESGGKTLRFPVTGDLSRCPAGKTVVLTASLPPCEGRLTLSFRRKWDGERILFATPSDEKGRVVLGEMG